MIDNTVILTGIGLRYFHIPNETATILELQLPEIKVQIWITDEKLAEHLKNTFVAKKETSIWGYLAKDALGAVRIVASKIKCYRRSGVEM